MTGNVWEWCLDLYEAYSASPVENPRGAKSGNEIVFRGAGWFEPEVYSRIALRGISDGREYSFRDLGFRVVME